MCVWGGGLCVCHFPAVKYVFFSHCFKLFYVFFYESFRVNGSFRDEVCIDNGVILQTQA